MIHKKKMTTWFWTQKKETILIFWYQDSLNSLTQRLIENVTILRLTEDSPAAAALHRPQSLHPISQHDNTAAFYMTGHI